MSNRTRGLLVILGSAVIALAITWCTFPTGAVHP